MKLSDSYLRKLVREELLREQGFRGKKEKSARSKVDKPHELLQKAEAEKAKARKELQRQLKRGDITRPEFNAAMKAVRRMVKANLKRSRKDRQTAIQKGRYEDFLKSQVDAITAQASELEGLNPKAAEAIAGAVVASAEAAAVKEEDPKAAAGEEGGAAAAKKAAPKKEKGVYRIHGDDMWEYKVKEERWHTRRQGRRSWHDLEPPDPDKKAKYKKSVVKLDKKFPDARQKKTGPPKPTEDEQAEMDKVAAKEKAAADKKGGDDWEKEAERRSEEERTRSSIPREEPEDSPGKGAAEDWEVEAERRSEEERTQSSIAETRKLNKHDIRSMILRTLERSR